VFAVPIGPTPPDPSAEDQLLHALVAAGVAVVMAGAALRLTRFMLEHRRALLDAAGRWLVIVVGLGLAAWMLGIGDLRVAAVVGAVLAAADPPYPSLSRRAEAAQALVAGVSSVHAVVGSTLSVLTVAALAHGVVLLPSPVPAMASVFIAAGVGFLLGFATGSLQRFLPTDVDQTDLLVVCAALVAYGLGLRTTGIGLLAAVCAGLGFGVAVRRHDADAARNGTDLQWFFAVGLLVALGGVVAGTHPILREAAFPLLALVFGLPVLLTVARRIAWAPPVSAGLGLVSAAAAPGVVALYPAMMASAAGMDLPTGAWATITVAAVLGVAARSAAASWPAATTA